MKKKEIDAFKEVRQKLRNIKGLLTYAIVHWDKDGFSAKNDNANAFFEMAIDNIKNVVNNYDYNSLCFDKQSLDDYENEYNKINLTGKLFEIKKLIANGLRYSIQEEIEYINNSIN